MSKVEIIKLIERLPENATETDVMEELYFRIRVEKGMKDAAEGRVISHSQIKDRIAEWRKSAGR